VSFRFITTRLPCEKLNRKAWARSILSDRLIELNYRCIYAFIEKHVLFLYLTASHCGSMHLSVARIDARRKGERINKQKEIRRQTQTYAATISLTVHPPKRRSTKYKSTKEGRETNEDGSVSCKEKSGGKNACCVTSECHYDTPILACLLNSFFRSNHSYRC